MSAILDPEVIDLLHDPSTTKVLATVDRDGRPHAVVRDSLHHGGDGTLHLLELLESSTTSRNLLASLWFDRKVAISLHGTDGRSVQIKGRPVKTHISGALFQHHYVKVRETLGDVDLAAVWEIVPEEVRDESFASRKARQDIDRPHLIHLDRITKPHVGRGTP
jgi:hypothetical protein